MILVLFYSTFYFFLLFDSYLRYGCQVWGQNKNVNTNEIAQLQDKAIRVRLLKDRSTAPGPLYNEKKKIRFFNLISFYNCLFIVEHLNQNLPSSFGGYFTYMDEGHEHTTRGASKKLVNVPQSKATFYGTNSITAKSVKDWNTLQSQVKFEFNQEIVITPKLISALEDYFLASYINTA